MPTKVNEARPDRCNGYAGHCVGAYAHYVPRYIDTYSRVYRLMAPEQKTVGPRQLSYSKPSTPGCIEGLVQPVRWRLVDLQPAIPNHALAQGLNLDWCRGFGLAADCVNRNSREGSSNFSKGLSETSEDSSGARTIVDLSWQLVLRFKAEGVRAKKKRDPGCTSMEEQLG